MTRLCAPSFSVSLDGYGAGPNQDLANPLGVGGEAVHRWFFLTKTFSRASGRNGGEGGIDDDLASRGFENIGAWIIGRNMFGPVRGPWKDETWKGWWGDTPPFHTPVFVLTNHPRPSFAMAGGTVFHFVTDGVRAALERATEAAGGKDIRLGGGVSTVRQYLLTKLVDELHVVVTPVLLGTGEALFTGIDLPQLGYTCSKHTVGENAFHFFITRDV